MYYSYRDFFHLLQFILNQQNLQKYSYKDFFSPFPIHIDPKTHVCVNCSKSVNAKDIKELDPKLQVLARMNIQAKDMFKKQLSFYFNEEWNALWIYSEAKNKMTTYYMITDDKKKFLHLEKVFKTKR